MFRRKKQYFFMISVSSTLLNRHVTLSGEFEWKGYEYDAYLDRLNYACKKNGIDPNHCLTVFWYMKPNKL
jgi:hypothetical protein